ncbi:Type II secretion system (T2SS), protein F [uncultured archaeon]|nr:Type II secretion system (T2SS), protein F [uncultured archaeon]
MTEENIRNIKESVFREKKIANEFALLVASLENADSEQEKKMINSQLEKLKISLRNANSELLRNLEETGMTAPLTRSQPEASKIASKPEKIAIKSKVKSEDNLPELDKEVLKRLRKKKGKKIVEKKEKTKNKYFEIASNLFSNTAKSLIKQKRFKKLGEDLIKSNLDYNLISYISVMLLNIAVALAIAFFLFIFLLFFNLSPTLPIISRATGSIGIRFLETFWLLLVAPGATFIFMYFYPSLEKKSIEGKIEAELPFAVIHMSAISGSMIDPTKIFSIISSTKEYPHLEKEFNKLMNEINIYGYDLVTALKESALNSPSQKLAELFNGLATTITSGGNMYEFFEKRAQSLLFDYRLDREKSTKTAETFMDIYISVVIAAPMILMLLLMMMKISGLGVSLSTSTITLLVVGGVSLINVLFLVFLQIKQQSTGG